MDYRIIILTATYNRPENLKKLFGTLLKQTEKKFQWIIVNDGSPKCYDFVVEDIKAKADFDMLYYHKDNGGKGSAINFAFDKISKGTFVVIIDDDEFLYPDAVEKVKRYVEKYERTNVAAIHFTRDDMNGKPISHPVIEKDYVMSVQEHKQKGYHSDGYIGYFTNKIGLNRFPIFEGEKYIGPSVMIMLVTKQYDLLWCRTSIGYTNYLEGGLTKQGRLLRMRNPKGMAFRCLQMLSNGSSLKNRLGFSIQYFAYLFLAGTKHPFSIKDWNLNPPLMPCITKPLGFILYRKWVRNYSK